MYLPKSDSGRLIVGTWWMVVLVVVTTYCGNLVAFLTFPKMEQPIDTVWQLLAQEGTYSWGIKSNTLLEKYLKVMRRECERDSLWCWYEHENCTRIFSVVGDRSTEVYAIERQHNVAWSGNWWGYRNGATWPTCVHRLENQFTAHYEATIFAEWSLRFQFEYERKHMPLVCE